MRSIEKSKLNAIRVNLKEAMSMKDETIKVAYETARQSVFTQLRNIANIDTKISVIIGFDSLIIVLSWQLYPHVQHALFFLGIGLLMLSLFLLLIAYRKKNWYISPSPQALVKRLKEGKEINEIYLQTIRNIAGEENTEDKKNDLKASGIYKANKKRINYKNCLLGISMHVLFIALVVIGLSRVFSCSSPV